MMRKVLLPVAISTIFGAASATYAQGPQQGCDQAAKTVGTGRVAKGDFAAFQTARRCGTVGARAVASARRE